MAYRERRFSLKNNTKKAVVLHSADTVLNSSVLNRFPEVFSRSVSALRLSPHQPVLMTPHGLQVGLPPQHLQRLRHRVMRRLPQVDDQRLGCLAESEIHYIAPVLLMISTRACCCSSSARTC